MNVFILNFKGIVTYLYVLLTFVGVWIWICTVISLVHLWLGVWPGWSEFNLTLCLQGGAVQTSPSFVLQNILQLNSSPTKTKFTKKEKEKDVEQDNCKFLFIPFYCVNHIQQLKIKDSSIEFLMKLRVLCKSDTSVQELITRNIHVHFLVNHKVLSGNISQQWKLSRVATI